MVDIGKAKAGDMDSHVDDYSVDPVQTDSPTETGASYENTNFTQYMGYYKDIPELGSTIDTKAFWVVGKGFTATKKVKAILARVTGWGKESFNQVCENGVRTYNIGGDFFAEIVTTDKKDINLDGSNLLNLKPLNPEHIVINANTAGILINYQYKVGTKIEQTFDPQEIFHLPWNRVIDEIHGTSTIRKVEQIILSRNEAMADMRTVFHRYVKPLWIWKLDTEDTTKIAAFQAKADAVVNSGDNIYIPKGAAEADRVSVPQYSTLDPLPWIENLNNYFYQATNMPDVILGSAKETTEASAKILYLAFQQSIEKNQLFLEEHIKMQLHLEVNFEFPASIETDLLKDNQKDGAVNNDKKDTQTGIKGKK